MKYWTWAILFLISINNYSACSLSWDQRTYTQKLIKDQSTQKVSLKIRKNSIDEMCSDISIKSEAVSTARDLVKELVKIPFNIYLDSARAKDLPFNGEQNLNSELLNLKSRGQGFVELFIKLNDRMLSAFLLAGIYQYTERLTLYSNGKRLDSINLQFSLEVPTEINLKLLRKGSNTSVGESLRFNKMIEGESVDLDVKMISNIGHSLWIESENSGYLNHEGLGEKIKYKVFVNGETLGDLSSSKQRILSTSNKSSEKGDKLGLKFQINQSIDKLPAGEYMDVIRLNIQSEM